MNHSFLQDALVFLAAAIIFVPIAKKLGMGSVFGYLIGGIIIGPFGFGFIGGEGRDIMHFAEFGVVMMLFLIGLELEPVHFWRLRHQILGMGSIQLVLTSLLFLAFFLIIGLTWQAALAMGLALSMSSTAIVHQNLQEKGLDETESGKSAFSVLLFQDMAVIPILALLPLLSLHTIQISIDTQTSFFAGLPGWVKTIALLIDVALIILAGHFLIVPFLRFIGRLHLRELFTISALFIVMATAYVFGLAGLSPALGTFLAGVVLANSEYRHELESDIEPFKGILLGLFFISVGACINFQIIIAKPLVMIGLVVSVIVLKSAVLFLTGRLIKLSTDQNLMFCLGLSQVGEFAFVLFAFMYQLRILNTGWTDMMMGVTALSMTATPLLLVINERFIDPRLGTRERATKAADDINTRYPVIIAGFGDFGSTVGRFLRANGIACTILDNDSDRVDLLRKMGFKVFYGDATWVDILKSAGAEQAKILVAAIGSPDLNQDLIDKAGRLFPHLTIMGRAEGRRQAYDLIDQGLEHIYREALDTSVRMGVDVLVKLGFRRYSAARAGQNFIRYDEEALRKLAPHRHDEATYIYNAREQIHLQEQLLTADRDINPTLNDHAWDSDLSTGEFIEAANKDKSKE